MTHHWTIVGRTAGAFGAIVAVAFGLAAPAHALPVFAHRYGFTCQQCHTVIPHLNAFGAAFADAGFRVPGVRPRGVFPIATKINLAYGSEPDPGGLPKAVVDEIELLTGGAAGTRASYFIETYLVDGGRPGTARDVWAGWRITPPGKIPLRLTAGEFTLPLPVDPETFRETALHYAIFDQTVGTNPFTFFAPKVGAALRAGHDGRGSSVEIAAVSGHDAQSGLPADGTDVMTVVRHAAGPLELSAYRYAGTRPDGAFADRFWRTGFGLVASGGRWESTTVLQTGRDTIAGGRAAASSGGFAQLRYAVTARFFALARYDGTNDPHGFTRTAVVLAGYRPARNTRLTLEDDIAHVPVTKHTFVAQYTLGY